MNFLYAASSLDYDIPNLHLIVKIYLFFVTRKLLQTVNRILRIFLQIRVACKKNFVLPGLPYRANPGRAALEDGQQGIPEITVLIFQRQISDRELRTSLTTCRYSTRWIFLANYNFTGQKLRTNAKSIIAFEGRVGNLGDSKLFAYSSVHCTHGTQPKLIQHMLQMKYARTKVRLVRQSTFDASKRTSCKATGQQCQYCTSPNAHVIMLARAVLHCPHQLHDKTLSNAKAPTMA